MKYLNREHLVDPTQKEKALCCCIQIEHLTCKLTRVCEKKAELEGSDRANRNCHTSTVQTEKKEMEDVHVQHL